MGKIYDNVLQLIGNTPMLHLNKIEQAEGLKAHLYAKVEGLNPGGSVKDRAALNMIEAAEAEGKLKHSEGLWLGGCTDAQTGRLRKSRQLREGTGAKGRRFQAGTGRKPASSGSA